MLFHEKQAVWRIIDQHIVPHLLLKSRLLLKETSVSKTFLTECGTMLCWNLSPHLHRVLVRTVLLGKMDQHRQQQQNVASDSDVQKLVRNLQTVIARMQVSNLRRCCC